MVAISEILRQLEYYGMPGFWGQQRSRALEIGSLRMRGSNLDPTGSNFHFQVSSASCFQCSFAKCVLGVCFEISVVKLKIFQEISSCSMETMKFSPSLLFMLTESEVVEKRGRKRRTKDGGGEKKKKSKKKKKRHSEDEVN